MKHKITYIKSLAAIVMFFCAMAFGYGQTTLVAGDIAITGFNSVDPDEFTFVLLTDVTTATEIRFTDEGWLAAGGFRGTGEGFLAWTADSDLICGTEILIKDSGATYAASTGTVTIPIGGAGFGLAVAGDQILAYQGTELVPFFIYAVNFDGAGWSDATSPNDSAIPTGLTSGTDAVDLGETDNGKYDCSVTADQALILAAVSTDTNWTEQNTTPLTLGGCTYTCDVTCPGAIYTWELTGWNIAGVPVASVPDTDNPVFINDDYFTNATNVSFSCCDLTINTGNTLTINDGYYVEVNNDLSVDGDIIVTPQGAFVQNNNDGGVAVSGSITVDKETAPMNVWYEYTYWSSPVSGETIGNALSFADVNRRFLFDGSLFLDSTAETGNDGAALPGQDDIDDDNNDWTLVAGTDTMTPGVGYAATHSEAAFITPPGPFVPPQFKYSFIGPFNNGVITVPVYRNNTETADNNWNLIGNPYPSAINADLFLATNTDIATNVVIDGAIFLWSQNTPPSNTNNGNQNLNFAGSDYAIINAVGQTAGGDGIMPSRNIPSGQGFFVVYSDAAIPVSTIGDISQGNVVFNNSMRVKGATDNSQFFRISGKQSKTNSIANKLWLDLTSDNGVFNQTLVGYVPGASNSNDGTAYDTTRNLSTGASAILYSNIADSNKKFAIQGKAENSLTEDEVISIGFKTSIDVATIYTLSIAQLEGDFLTSNAIYLKDNLLNTLRNLKDGDYNFTSEVGEFNERFEIVFNSEALSLDESAITDKALSIIELSNGEVQFKLTGNQTMKSIQIIDLQGRTVYNFKTNSVAEIYNLSNLSQTAYIAKVELSDGYVITKKAIKRY